MLGSGFSSSLVAYHLFRKQGVLRKFLQTSFILSDFTFNWKENQGNHFRLWRKGVGYRTNSRICWLCLRKHNLFHLSLYSTYMYVCEPCHMLSYICTVYVLCVCGLGVYSQLSPRSCAFSCPTAPQRREAASLMLLEKWNAAIRL